LAGDDTAVVDEETKRNKIISREDGIVSEHQKLDSATVSAQTKQAKAPRSCHAGADAGCSAIITGEELEALYLPDRWRRHRRNAKLIRH